MTDEVTIESLQAQLEAATASVGKLETKNQELLGESKSVKAKAKEAEEARALATEVAARESGSFEDMDNSHKDKFSKREAELLAIIEQRDGQIGGLTSGATSLKMAAELAVEGSSDELHQLIKSRFSTVIADGAAKTVILDADGKLSALTYDELKAELSERRGLAPLISGSKASGSGGAGSKLGGGAASAGKSSFNGSKDEKTNAAIKAVPALASLPRN